MCKGARLRTAFKREKQNLKIDEVVDQEPVELLKNRGDVISGRVFWR